MRRTNAPPCLRANIQLNNAVRALPTWIEPLGAGSMRVRTCKRLLDEVEPVEVLLVASSTYLGVSLLESLRDRTRLVLPTVDLADRDDLGRAAGEEQLVGRVQVGAVERRLVHRRPLIAGDLDHGLARDAGQRAVNERRGQQFAP